MNDSVVPPVPRVGVIGAGVVGACIAYALRKRGFDGPVLVDQGSADQFLDLLKPEALAEAMASRRQQSTFRMQKGYDHSYFFVSTFIESHMAFHADALLR